MKARSWKLGGSDEHRRSASNLHVVAALVAWLASLALRDAIGTDVAIDDVAGISMAVAALGVRLLFDHQLAIVPARLGRRLAGRAVLLREAHLALAFVVKRVGRVQIGLACGGG